MKSTRTPETKLLQNLRALLSPQRMKICSLLWNYRTANNGISFSILRNQLFLTSSELSYHLKHLIAEGLVEKRENSNYHLTTKGYILLSLVEIPLFMIDLFLWLENHPNVIIPAELTSILWRDADSHQLITGTYVIHDICTWIQHHTNHTIKLFFSRPLWDGDLVFATTLLSLSKKTNLYAVTINNSEKQTVKLSLPVKIIDKGILKKIFPDLGSFIITDDRVVHHFFHDRYHQFIPTMAIRSTSQRLIKHCQDTFERIVSFTS